MKPNVDIFSTDEVLKRDREKYEKKTVPVLFFISSKICELVNSKSLPLSYGQHFLSLQAGNPCISYPHLLQHNQSFHLSGETVIQHLQSCVQKWC